MAMCHTQLIPAKNASEEDHKISRKKTTMKEVREKLNSRRTGAQSVARKARENGW